MENQLLATRRQTLAMLGGSSAAVALSACQPRIAGVPTANAEAFLEAAAWQLLELQPEGATSLGIDTGVHAGLRRQLGDRTAAGRARLAGALKSALRTANTFPLDNLDPASRTSLTVVKSAFSTALDGFALPYGSVAVGGWRNAPYAVIQNVGAYLDTPRFLDSEHPVKDAADAEAYLARLSQFPPQLDGELGRIKEARGKGLIPPAFLLDKAIRQMELTLSDAQAGGGLVTSLVHRTKTIPGQWDARASAITTGPVAAALARQLAELKAQRAVATMDAGLLKRPHGDEWYAWALRASTTTRRTPDEVTRWAWLRCRSFTGGWIRSCASSASPAAPWASG